MQGKGGEGHLKLGIGNHLRPAHHSVAPHSLSPQRQNIIWPCKYTFYTSGALPFAFWPFSLHTYCKYVENTWVQSSIALYFNTLHTLHPSAFINQHCTGLHPIHTPHWYPIYWYYWHTGTGTIGILALALVLHPRSTPPTNNPHPAISCWRNCLPRRHISLHFRSQCIAFCHMSLHFIRVHCISSHFHQLSKSCQAYNGWWDQVFLWWKHCQRHIWRNTYCLHFYHFLYIFESWILLAFKGKYMEQCLGLNFFIWGELF